MSFNFFENYNEIKQWISDLDDMVGDCFEWCCKLRPDHSNRNEIMGNEWEEIRNNGMGIGKFTQRFTKSFLGQSAPFSKRKKQKLPRSKRKSV